MATPTTCASLAAAVLLLAGCGRGTGTGTAQPGRGRMVFARSCAGCHSLTGHDTNKAGGDLAVARLSDADLAGFVRVMPVHLRPLDVEAVAAYVHAAAERRHGH